MQIPSFKVKVVPKLKQQKYITYGLDPGTPPGPRSGFAGSGLFPNKEWEDLCFRCYDEGELLMCDFRTCPKVRCQSLSTPVFILIDCQSPTCY